VLPSEVKKREELEVSVGNVELTRQILQQLGFTRMLYYQKWRESWRLDDCRIELDEPPRIGLFVEIEGPDESAILAVRAKLDLTSAPHENASYVRMLTDYCDAHGIADHTLQLARDHPG
jgi:predicted adenylyl cyclase CyaB